MAFRTSPCPILMLHRVGKPDSASAVAGHYVSPRLFDRQLRILRRLGYESVPLADLANAGGDMPRKPVAITFDDGYASFHSQALPILERYGYRATVFLVADLIGGDNIWDLANGDVREPLLSAAQIAEGAERGVEFGSHTLTHEDLSACPADEARRQIERSKSSIEELTGRPVQTFCYPYGRSTPEVRSAVRNAGYKLACGTGKGVFRPESDIFNLPRINVRRDTLSPIFLYKLWRGVVLGR